MAYFDDPKVRLQEELEDLREDIAKKERKIRELIDNIAGLDKEKELAEGELDDLLAEEKNLQRELTRLRMEV